MLTTTQPKPGVGGVAGPLPTVNHRVRKDRIVRSIVEGVAVRAACGERFVVEAQGSGRTDAPEAMNCPICEWLYGQMRSA